MLNPSDPGDLKANPSDLRDLKPNCLDSGVQVRDDLTESLVDCGVQVRDDLTESLVDCGVQVRDDLTEILVDCGVQVRDDLMDVVHCAFRAWLEGFIRLSYPLHGPRLSPVMLELHTGRMDNKAIWTERVAEWKASGQSSKAYCEGKPFTAGGLRHWAHRLRQQEESKTRQPQLRIARVVRRASGESRPARPGRSAEERKAAPATLAIECGSLRVSVYSGFDRELLTAVLEVLSARGGGQ